MAPKFRGGKEDWMDDEASARRGGRRPPRKSGKAEALEESEANATVIEVLQGFCRAVLDEAGHAVLLCRYRRADVWGHYRDPKRPELSLRERSPVAVGDRVLVERVGGPQSKEGVVAGVALRRNRLVRPAPARDETVLHVLAANLDALVIVASTRDPDFTPGLVDRFLIAAQNQGIEAILCVNKVDRISGSESRPWELYGQWGVQVFETCAKTLQGIETLRGAILGRRVAFCGKSGVGKTSILSAITGRTIGKVQEISDATGKGRHTTTSAVLLPSPEGSQWIDTPGVREFGLIGIEPLELARFFPEFLGLRCQENGCTHRDESDCTARDLPRYSSYVRILESLEAGEH